MCVIHILDRIKNVCIKDNPIIKNTKRILSTTCIFDDVIFKLFVQIIELFAENCYKSVATFKLPNIFNSLRAE